MAELCLFKNKLCQKKNHGSFIILVALVILSGTHKKSFFGKPLTAAVIGTRWWVGWDSIREQKNIEAKKILENGDESHQSGARFVRQTR